ncbi:MAG: ATP-binding cassette domain-containing protein [Pseudomonadales bacterium]|nr:ATP-binding cassette domain-containing protein [Pseudomonadales bacterium]
MITVTGLEKRFGEVLALRGISFVAENGEVTGLLGPNGAGKSTTLRILYGLVRPDAGQASIDGIDIVDDARAAQARIGVLTDAHGLYSRLTAREHIAYFGRLQGMGGEALESRTEELIDLLDMKGIADRRTEGFSQGEKTKVCLAKCLVHDPPNVLLDEPTNGLDVMTTRVVRELIDELRRLGVTVLFSSHLMHEVARLCDKIVIISMGQRVAEGTADEIRREANEEDLEEAFVKLSESVTVP